MEPLNAKQDLATCALLCLLFGHGSCFHVQFSWCDICWLSVFYPFFASGSSLLCLEGFVLVYRAIGYFPVPLLGYPSHQESDEMQLSAAMGFLSLGG